MILEEEVAKFKASIGYCTIIDFNKDGYDKYHNVEASGVNKHKAQNYDVFAKDYDGYKCTGVYFIAEGEIMKPRYKKILKNKHIDFIYSITLKGGE